MRSEFALMIRTFNTEDVDRLVADGDYIRHGEFDIVSARIFVTLPQGGVFEVVIEAAEKGSAVGQVVFTLHPAHNQPGWTNITQNIDMSSGPTLLDIRRKKTGSLWSGHKFVSQKLNKNC